ncbi:MAG: hypothetical protein ACP5JK_02975, partial [Candidatus Aenigmatarchaeota archaeon]
MKKVVLILLFFSLILINIGFSATWKSCCSSGCDSSPEQVVTVDGKSYICCSDGWHEGTSCGGTTTTTTTTSTTTSTTTTTTTITSCSSCGYYSSSNCNNACLEDQQCIKETCGNNPNCYTCKWKTCDKVNPKVTILSSILSSGSNLTINVLVQCSDWTYSPSKDFNMSLFIDGKYWSICEINNKRLAKDLGWDMIELDMSKGCKHCGGEYKNWTCDNNGYCKHKDYNIVVYSDTSKNLLN